MARYKNKKQAVPVNSIVFGVIAVFVLGSVVYAGWGSEFLGAKAVRKIAAATPTPVPMFSCTPRQQTVIVGHTVMVSEDPFEGSFSANWAAPGGSKASGTGRSFQTTYATPGDYTITATSIDFPGGMTTDNCRVKVMPTPTPTPGPQSWQNPRNRFDVNDDGYVTSNDLLRLNNTFNNKGVRDLVKTSEPVGPPYIDVTGDKWFTAADIQAVSSCIRKGGKNC